MVDVLRAGEKNSDGPQAWLPVVAAALMTADGLWLMHQRPAGKMYAGLWEFPGGKVEPSERPALSLVRELAEELGITVNAGSCQPALFAQQAAHRGAGDIVLMLYIVSQWDGTPRALEGGDVAWLTPAEALALPMPPMDRDLAERLWR
ncbi:MAG: (deoxy)nucleoside triphosphate pyrophosphohydrolase [Erythrobacter sp.]